MAKVSARGQHELARWQKVGEDQKTTAVLRSDGAVLRKDQVWFISCDGRGEWLGGSSYGIEPRWRLARNAAEWRRLTDEERARRRALLAEYFTKRGFTELPARR